MVDLDADFVFSYLESQGEEALLRFIINELDEGKMSSEHQKQLAAFFRPKGREKFRLKLTRKPGIPQKKDRISQFEERLEPFREFRAWVLNEFKEEIKLKGEDMVIIAQAELPKVEGGFGVSKPTAKKLLEVLKVDDETAREMHEKRLSCNNGLQGNKNLSKLK